MAMPTRWWPGSWPSADPAPHGHGAAVLATSALARLGVRDGRAQAQQVAVHAATGNLTLRDLGQHRGVAEGLARMHVGHVHLDDGALEDGQRVADAVAVVGPGAGVD